MTSEKDDEHASQGHSDELEKMEAQRRQYEAIMAATPDLIYVFDKNYRFTFANAALLQMWGKNSEEALGKSLLENGYEDWHAAMHEREIDQVIATKQSVRGVVSFPHATQGKRVYDYIFVPVFNRSGEVESIAGTTRDITDITRANEGLKESEAHLQQLVTDRTIQLQRSNDDLQQFAHVASHDMKEPVRKILLFADRIRRDFYPTLDTEVQTSVDKIHKAAERMFQMISGVLLYSSLSADDQPFESVDLSEVLRSIEEDLELVIGQKEANVSYTSLPVITGSPVLLYQLFYNLINNALKFTKPGIAPLITVTCTLASPSELGSHDLANTQEFYKVVVEDNGIGFEQQAALSIFQSFNRLHSRDEYEGTGLGLALCSKITERHGGAIYAESEVGQGSRFIVLLPRSTDS